MCPWQVRRTPNWSIDGSFSDWVSVVLFAKILMCADLELLRLSHALHVFLVERASVVCQAIAIVRAIDPVGNWLDMMAIDVFELHGIFHTANKSEMACIKLEQPAGGRESYRERVWMVKEIGWDMRSKKKGGRDRRAEETVSMKLA